MLGMDDAGFEIEDFEERRGVRRAVRANCQVVTERGFRLLGEQTLDLSEAGLLLRSDDEVEPGEAVLISLQVPGSAGWIDAEGKVARQVRGRRGNEDKALGVAFEHLGSYERAVLHGALRRQPPITPQRRRRRNYAATVIALGLFG